MRKAFTMIELILVMVILAIVSTIGTDVLRSLYDNYASSAQINRLEMQANNAADLIAARLDKRVPQTTAVYAENKFTPIANAENKENESLIFYRKAYELERNFLTKKLNNGYNPSEYYSGYIESIDTKSDSSGEESTSYEDTITLTTEEQEIKNDYDIFFSNDDGMLYKDIYKDIKPDNDEIFKAYYGDDAQKYSFAYHCSSPSLDLSYDGNKKIRLERKNCPLSDDKKIRPSMANFSHKFYLSNEINKITLEGASDTTTGKLYLEICDALTNKTCETPNEKHILATNVSSFRFTVLGNDPAIASGIVFKICIREGEKDSSDASEVCQSRIVR